MLRQIDLANTDSNPAAWPRRRGGGLPQGCPRVGPMGLVADDGRDKTCKIKTDMSIESH